MNRNTVLAALIGAVVVLIIFICAIVGISMITYAQNVAAPTLLVVQPTDIVNPIQWATAVLMATTVPVKAGKADVDAYTYLMLVSGYCKNMANISSDYSVLLTDGVNDNSLYLDANWKRQVYAKLDEMVYTSKTASELQAPAAYAYVQTSWVTIYQDMLQTRYYMKDGMENFNAESISTANTYIQDVINVTKDMTQRLNNR